MNRIKNGFSALLSAVLSVSVLASASVLRAESAQEILAKVDKAQSYKTFFSEVEQTITTSSGAKRTLVIRGWAADNGDRQLSLYLSPSDIRGQLILLKDDGNDIWMHNAETGRTRKLGSHMKKKKVMGSDFTYEDQCMYNLSKKYAPVMKGEDRIDGVDCVLLELTPTGRDPVYSKLVVYVPLQDYVPRRVDYYEKGEDKPFKRLELSDVKEVDGLMVPFTLKMKSLRGKSETVNVTTKARVNIEVSEDLFDADKMVSAAQK